MPNRFQFGRITSDTKKYWFNLIQLYELIGNDDVLQGIWSSMIDCGTVLLKESSSGEMSQDFVKTISLIKSAQNLRAKGSISKGLKELEIALDSPILN